MKGVEAVNNVTFANLKRCLTQVPLGRPSTEHSAALDSEMEEEPCAPETFTVIVGTMAYFTFASLKNSNSGEAVWLRSVLEALEEDKYSVLTVPTYPGMVRIHREMPDVISHIWAEDKFTLSCQMDPRCLADFKPTLETYPDAKDHRETTFEAKQKGEVEPRKIVWTQQELDEIPEHERGNVPLWKLFTISFVSLAVK